MVNGTAIAAGDDAHGSVCSKDQFYGLHVNSSLLFLSIISLRLCSSLSLSLSSIYDALEAMADKS